VLLFCFTEWQNGAHAFGRKKPVKGGKNPVGGGGRHVSERQCKNVKNGALRLNIGMNPGAAFLCHGRIGWEDSAEAGA
jgi:hypothetical protein